MAAVQLWNDSVAVPTGSVLGAGVVGASNSPPLVS